MTPRQVQKSSGYMQRWDSKKLERSIQLALNHAGAGAHGSAARAARETVHELERSGLAVVPVDLIRETVIRTLRTSGETWGAEAYELVSLHLTAHPTSVRKRSGRTEPFHPLKLFKSLKKSFEGVGLMGGSASEKLTREIAELLAGSDPVHVATVRRTASRLLREQGYQKVETRYLLHKYL